MQNDPGILITAIGALLLGLLVFFEGLNGWKYQYRTFWRRSYASSSAFLL